MKGRKSVLCVKVDPDVKYAIMAYAASTGVHAADIVSELIRKYLPARAEEASTEAKA